MLVTNSRTYIPTPVPVLPGTPPKTEPIARIVPPPVVPKREVPATNLPAIKTNAVAAVVSKPPTNAPPARTNAITTAVKTSAPTNDLKAKMESPAVKPAPKPVVADAKGVTNAPAAPAKPAGQLAVATPGASGGWHYLAAAIALLLAAGGIIAYLLRPQPNPSAISQSIDDKRV